MGLHSAGVLPSLSKCPLVRKMLVLQGVRQLFSAGKDREATEILVEHIMLVSPGADKERMLKYWQFDERGELVDWNLSYCKISQLPESFCALVCRRDRLGGSG